jgi:hypothetical protein
MNHGGHESPKQGLREIVWVIRGLSGSSCSGGGVSAAALDESSPFTKQSCCRTCGNQLGLSVQRSYAARSLTARWYAPGGTPTAFLKTRVR